MLQQSSKFSPAYPLRVDQRRELAAFLSRALSRHSLRRRGHRRGQRGLRQPGSNTAVRRSSGLRLWKIGLTTRMSASNDMGFIDKEWAPQWTDRRGKNDLLPGSRKSEHFIAVSGQVEVASRCTIVTTLSLCASGKTGSGPMIKKSARALSNYLRVRIARGGRNNCCIQQAGLHRRLKVNDHDVILQSHSIESNA